MPKFIAEPLSDHLYSKQKISIPPLKNYTPTNHSEPTATMSGLMQSIDPKPDGGLVGDLKAMFPAPNLSGMVKDYYAKLSNPDPSLGDAASLFSQYAIPGGAAGAAAIALSDTSRAGGLGTVGGALARGFNEAKSVGGKFQIADDLAKLKGLPRGFLEGKPLSEVLDHPELYAQYPELKDLTVQRMMPNLNNLEKGGEFVGGEKPIVRVKTGRGPQAETSSLLHEIQHVIQDKEGWPISEVMPTAVQRAWEFKKKMQEMKS